MQDILNTIYNGGKIMKKTVKLFSIILAVVLCLSVLASCGPAIEKTPKNDSLSRMTIDINPSVEFILDEENKVVSVTALNDDGAIILSGEAFVGMSADDAAELVVSIAAENGYLLKGSASADDNEVSIGLTGNVENAKELYKKIESKVSKFIKDNGLDAVVEKAESMSHEALAELAAHCTAGLSEEAALKMTDQELLSLLNESRKETAAMLSEEMREFYYKLRDSEYAFAESKEMNKIIEAMDDSYKVLVKNYDSHIELLRKAIDALKKAQNENIFSNNSTYREAYEALDKAKAEYAEQVKKVEALEDSVEKEQAKGILAIKKLALEAAEDTLDYCRENAEEILEAFISGLEKAVENLEEMKKDLPEEVKTKLAESAKDIENAMNEFKKNFYAEFEKEYKQAIDEYNKMIADSKAK